MALQEYNRKRDFRKTSEPKGKKAASNGELPLFVIQKHAASRLHYDVRIEHKGVLVSFAVPKEPSMSLSVKRLAIHVEDHPLDYAAFEGDIPEGEYGAGHVVIWDKGTYSYPGVSDRTEISKRVEHGIRKGHILVELHGVKLKGRFSFIKLKNDDQKGDNWLFFRTGMKMRMLLKCARLILLQ
ncbi:MAG: putative DNA ligase-like protein [candidate division WS6 bacterium OLB20]|uniref:Putative DNA ligase-like protein n=1 Tax=candidate division WS6 bacterium OLB20 TaxID=1617426 RepID=A0A136LW61_9BACT|nr:MAG: putative DNA ligase-like protein [candidate division WS6 bacterium OLB20]